MADTTLSPTGLVQIEVGASDDTWGTKENTDKSTINGWFDDAGGGVPALKVANGGTGSKTASAARTALGLTDAAIATMAEGSWTPVLSLTTPGTSSFTYGTQYGGYRRDGSWLLLDLNLSSVVPTIATGSGSLLVSGIPVNATSANAALAACGAAYIAGGTISGISGGFVLAMTGVSTLRFIYGSPPSSTVGASNLTTGVSFSIQGSIAYRVA